MQKSLIKRFTSLILAFLIVFGLFGLPNAKLTVKAATTPDGFVYTITGGEVTITGYEGSATELVIPATIESYPVINIGNSAFQNCINITNVKIPNGVTSIGINAFAWCANLVSVTIPDSVVTIEFRAFGDCYSLTSVMIPKNVTSMGRSVFAWCHKLPAINVAPDNPNYISVDGILFSKDKTTLSEYPAGKSNTSYDIPNGIISVADSAFVGNGKLTIITIPESVTFIGTDTLNITRLTKIDVDSKNSNYISVDGILFDKNRNTLIAYPAKKEGNSYNIPNTVTFVRDTAFINSSLKSVTIPESVVSIGASAFAGSELTSVTIPKSVTSIGASAFANNSNLKSVTILSTNLTNIGSFAFNNLPADAVIYVLTEAVKTLVSNSGFTGNIAIIGEVTYGDLNGDTTVDTADLVILAKHIAEIESLAGLYAKAADINGDDKVNIADLILLSQQLVAPAP